MIHFIIALVLFGHGVAHVSGFIASVSKKDIGFHIEKPWIFSNNITLQSPLGKFFGILWLAATAGYVLAAIVLIASNDWWTTLLIPAATVSLLVIIPFWNTVPPGAKFGAFFDLFVIIVFTTSLKEYLSELV